MDFFFVENKLHQGGPLDDQQQEERNTRPLSKSFGGGGRFNKNIKSMTMTGDHNVGKVINILEATEDILRENDVSFSPRRLCSSSSNDQQGQSMMLFLEPLPLGPRGSRRLVDKISLINCADSLLLGESQVDDREALFDALNPFLMHQHETDQNENEFKSPSTSNKKNLKLRSAFTGSTSNISSLFTNGSDITTSTTSTTSTNKRAYAEEAFLIAKKEQEHPVSKRQRLQQDKLPNEATSSTEFINADFNGQDEEESSNFMLDPSIFDLDDDDHDETTTKKSHNNLVDLDRQAAMVQVNQHQFLHHNIAQQYKQEERESSQQLGEKRFRTYQFDQWMEKFQELIQFRSIYGHCLVPHNFPPNQQLAQWVKRQRYQYKLKQQGRHSTLTKERQFELDQMGFIWDSHQAIWVERFEDLKTFKAKHGHCSVPSKYVDRTLAIWVKCQRRQYKLYQQGCSSSMTQSRMEQMESLGFDWNPRNL